MPDPSQPPSPAQLTAFDNGLHTSEQIDPLAYEKSPAVQPCPYAHRGAAASQAPGDSPADEPPIKNVLVTIFFDGTNNNMLRDAASPTNVVRLFDLHQVGWDEPSKTMRGALYVRGVGSFDDQAYSQALGQRLKAAQAQQKARISGLAALAPAPGGSDGAVLKDFDPPAPPSWAERKAAAAQNTLGMASGYGAADRIASAYDWVKAKSAIATPQGTINVNSVGFSRGAATARSFWNAYRQWLGPELTKMKPASPNGFGFLGLFDTVASFGADAGGGDTPTHNIVLSGDLGTSIYHAVAQDEFRSNFRYNPAEAGVEVFYSGCHSDIGGGYGANEQDRTADLAKVTLTDMFDAAVGASLPLTTLSPAVRVLAEQLRQQAGAFQASRQQVWTMAFDLAKDCVYPTMSWSEAEAWLRAGTMRLNKPSSWFSGSAPLTADEQVGFEPAFKFWRRYIHLPYYLRWRFGAGEADGSNWSSAPISNPADDVGPGFTRNAAVAKPKVPVSGYPNFDWAVEPDPSFTDPDLSGATW